MNDAAPVCPPLVSTLWALPDDGQTAYVQGLHALRDGNLTSAIPLLEQAAALQPSHPGRRRNLVRALLAAEQFVPVLHHVEAGLPHAPDDAELHFARGCALARSAQPALARAAFVHAVSLRPGHAPSWLNLGNACFDLDEYDTAESCYRQAIALDRSLPEALVSLGYLLTRQGHLTDALACCNEAIRLRPELVQAHWNRAIALLLQGNLREGLATYEWRKRHDRFRSNFPALPWPAWDGSNPAGRTILIRAEQGAGDAIQFVRYLPLIREAGGCPVLLCSPGLIPLFRPLGVRAVTSLAGSETFDAWADLCSLPHLFGTELASIPALPGYLRADPGRAQAWHSRLPAGRKIGIAFAGNPDHSGDRWRSIPPALLAPLLTMPDVTFVNLQHGPAAAAIALPDLTPQLPDYAETAALIANLDLVISADTSVAHLSAALGKPTWIMLPHAPDWRWMLRRTDSPWYPSVTLYRQPAPGDWTSVITRVAADLGLNRRQA